MIAVGPWLDLAGVREPILRSPHRPHTCWFGHMRGLVQGDVHCCECRRRPFEGRDVQLLVSDIERLLLGRLSVFLGHVALLPRAASSKGTARRQRSRSQRRGGRERERVHPFRCHECGDLALELRGSLNDSGHATLFLLGVEAGERVKTSTGRR